MVLYLYVTAGLLQHVNMTPPQIITQFPHLIRGRPHGNIVTQVHLATVSVGNKRAINPERFHRTLLKWVMWTFIDKFVCLCFLQSARHDEAWMVLRQVHDTNWKAKGEPERVFTVSLYLQHCCFAQSLTKLIEFSPIMLFWDFSRL